MKPKKYIISFLLLVATIAGYSQDISELKINSKKGDPEAQFKLASFYHFKQNDYEKAFYWYKKSAKQKHAKSQAGLGMLYFDGHGVKRNIEKTVYWWKKSAKHGSQDAQYGLGVLYFHGLGINQNRQKAYFWIKKAKKAGHEEAEKFWNDHNIWKYE